MNSKASLTNPTDNFVQTYFTLRVTLGALALALPLAVYVAGRWFQDLPLQPAISAYYYSAARDILVGSLCAIGCGLVAYKGFGRDEDWAMNLGGVLACCIALFPMDSNEALHCIQSNFTEGIVNISAKLHYPAAVLFYLVLGYVMIFCAHRTLYLVPPKVRRWYLAAYPTLGFAFVASIVVAFVFGRFVLAATDCQDHTVFWVEVAGIVPFGLFWLLKTHECRKYDTDLRILDRQQASKIVPPPFVAPTLPPAPSEPLDRPAKAELQAVPAGIQKRSAWEQYKALWRDDSTFSRNGGTR